MRTRYLANGGEEKLCEKVTVHDMSDEEDGDDGFKVKTPSERPDQISDLIVLLDQRHNEKLEKEERRIPKVKRTASNSPRKELTYNNN